eukprot:6193001-Pleurochrysis_carterae.AAC.3
MDNMMPAPNQMPAPGQKVALSTDRVVSTIPRGGDAGTWMYPSEQARSIQFCCPCTLVLSWIVAQPYSNLRY